MTDKKKGNNIEMIERSEILLNKAGVDHDLKKRMHN